MSGAAMAMASCASSSASLACHSFSPSAAPAAHHHLTRIALGKLPRSGCFHASRRIHCSSRRDWGVASSSAQVQGAETSASELPAKLEEIVRLFQQVGEQRARYQQLLYYGQKMTPLPKEHCTPENKVSGCVSQVWVVCTLDSDDGRVYFQAESDSALTKGLAALLVEGLSGATPGEVLKITPDFVQKLGLQQSLTPSRSNGFINMLRLMQKKTLQAYKESSNMPAAAAAAAASGEEAEIPRRRRETVTKVEEEKVTTIRDSIVRKLSERLEPVELVVDDVSHQHAGHAGAPRGSSETHFNVKVVSEEFQGLSLVKRHRLIYGLLEEELQAGLHALSLITKTPAEVSS